jgi:hypothetical protein
VHTEAASDPPDSRKQLDEVRTGGQQFPEFVDNHHQVGQRITARQVPGVPALMILADAVDVPDLSQHSLAALLFTE